MRQLLNVFISPPACGAAGLGRAWQRFPGGLWAFMSLRTPHPRSGALMSRCHGDGMVVTAHHSCLRPFPHRIPLIPFTSVSPASPLRLSQMSGLLDEVALGFTGVTPRTAPG